MRGERGWDEQARQQLPYWPQPVAIVGNGIGNGAKTLADLGDNFAVPG